MQEQERYRTAVPCWSTPACFPAQEQARNNVFVLAHPTHHGGGEKGDGADQAWLLCGNVRLCEQVLVSYRGCRSAAAVVVGVGTWHCVCTPADVHAASTFKRARLNVHVLTCECTEEWQQAADEGGDRHIGSPVGASGVCSLKQRGSTRLRREARPEAACRTCAW